MSAEQTFNFANTELWPLLLLVPLLTVIFLLAAKRREERRATLIDSTLLGRAVERLPELQKLRRVNAVIATIALICFAIAALRPQWGFIWGETSHRGVDIVVAVDVSESMLARDISPSRLERARREVLDLLQRVKGDRLALVAFAGDAFLQAPLTYDLGTFRSFLDLLSPDLIPIPGTNIQAALQRSIDSLKAGEKGTDDEQEKGKLAVDDKDRAIVLITDGEDFSGDLSAIREQAAKAKIHLFIFGIGTEEGAPIPRGDGFKRDNKGKMVLTRLRVDSLKELAEKTGGVFVKSIATDQDTELIYEQGIKRVVEDGLIKGSRGKVWNEYFQYPSFIGVMLLIFLAWREELECA